MTRFDKICTYSWSRLRVARPRNNPGKKMPKKLSSNLDWVPQSDLKQSGPWHPADLAAPASSETALLGKSPFRSFWGQAAVTTTLLHIPIHTRHHRTEPWNNFKASATPLKKRKVTPYMCYSIWCCFRSNVPCIILANWWTKDFGWNPASIDIPQHCTLSWWIRTWGDLGPRQLLFSINAVNGDVMPISNSPSVTNLQWHRRQGGLLLWADGWEPIAAIDGHSVTGAQELALGVPFTAAYQ